MEYGHRGAYTGFMFNNVHSSTLGITRVSNNNRYDDQLIPLTKELTVDIGNSIGQMYYGTTYSKRDISVLFAFSGMDDVQLRRLRQVWSDKQLHALTFDENPYKVYTAKCTGNAVIKRLAFTRDGIDYYNGEGSFTFTCYFPYARSRYNYDEDYNVNSIHEWVGDKDYDVLLYDAKLIDHIRGNNVFYDLSPSERAIHGYLVGITEAFAWLEMPDLLINYADQDWTDVNSYVEFDVLEESVYNNKAEWISASNIPSKDDYGQFDPTNKTYKLFNAGDISMGIKLTYTVSDTPQTMVVRNGTNVLTLTNCRRINSNDTYIVIDMYAQTIQGYNAQNKPTGTLYDCYRSGDYFLVPTGEQYLYTSIQPQILEFNYLYL